MAAQPFWPTLDDLHAVVQEMVKLGYKMCTFVGSIWFLGLEAVGRVCAYLHTRYMASGIDADRAYAKAEEEAPYELLRLAATGIGYHADVALALMGFPPAPLRGPLEARVSAATAANRTRNAQYFSRKIRPKIERQIAESLEALVCEPPTLIAALQIA